MKKYLEHLKTFRTLFTHLERMSAFFGGMLFSLLIFIPVFIILAEMMIVYIYLIYTLVVILIFAVMACSITWSHFNKKALYLKKAEFINHPSIRYVFFVNQIIFNVIISIIGICFLLWWIPILMV